MICNRIFCVWCSFCVTLHISASKIHTGVYQKERMIVRSDVLNYCGKSSSSVRGFLYANLAVGRGSGYTNKDSLTKLSSLV